MSLGLGRGLALLPLQQPVQVVAQFHLSLEHLGLLPLAQAIAGLGHLDHLLPELLVLPGEVKGGVGQGERPVGHHHPGAHFVDLILVEVPVHLGLGGRHLRAQPPLAGEGEFLGNHDHLLGHVVLVQTPGVGGHILQKEGKLRVVQGFGRPDGLPGRGLEVGHLLDLRVGLQGFADHRLQVRRQPRLTRRPLGKGQTQSSHDQPDHEAQKCCRWTAHAGFPQGAGTNPSRHPANTGKIWFAPYNIAPGFTIG